MRPFFFQWPRIHDGRLQQMRLVAFVPECEIDPRSLATYVGEAMQQSPICSAVIVLGFAYNKSNLLAARETICERLPVTNRDLQDCSLQFWVIRVDGEIEDEHSHVDSRETQDLFKIGAFELFCADGKIPPRSPLLVAPLGFHFIKPSKQEHTTHFIRTAEVLTEGAEIEFVAASLLRFVRPDTEAVYCDTASIAVLGFALEGILARFAALQFTTYRRIAVTSFGSWEGISTPPSDPTAILFSPAALYLISASTGGGLARKMRDLEFSPERIVTIFHYGHAPEVGAAICHIVHEQKLRSGTALPRIENFPAQGCRLCDLGSTTLELRGDQFVPTSADVRVVDLNLKDRPIWLAAFMESALGTGTLRAHYHIGKRSHIHEIFVCLHSLCSKQGSKFVLNLEQAIRQSAPFSADRIYFCDDSGAELIAQKTEVLMKHMGLNVELIPVSALRRNIHGLKRRGGSSIVAAGCVSTGRSLVDLSRMLRDVEEDGAISFVIGLRRTRNAAEQDHLQSTLTLAAGRLSFALHSVQDIYLPDNTAERESIWTKEELFLTQLLSESASNLPVGLIESRLDTLRQAQGGDRRGLTNDLFWPDVSGNPLELRSNFSIFEVPQGVKPTQAELFFAVSTMLHKLRLADSTTGRSLTTNAHQRTLIHPSTFLRFSDGVIQAAILRACLRSELDYEIRPSVEAEAMSVLQSIFSRAGEPEGEAAIEFLLALALKQIRLSQAGLANVLDVAIRHFTDPERIEYHLARHVSSSY